MLTFDANLIRSVAIPAFWQAWEDYPSITEGIVYGFDSNADQETQSWLSPAPSVREMGAKRLSREIPSYNFTIKNKKWEITIPIKYELLRFDNWGAVANAVRNGAAKHRAHFDKLVTQVMAAGHSTACYDAQFFYDTDHVDVGGEYVTAQDNDLTSTAATGVAPTDLEMAAAVRGLRNALFAYKDAFGDPASASLTNDLRLHVPIDLLAVAERVATADALTGPVSNDVKGKFTPVYNPYLTTAGIMFMHNPTGIHKPFVLQTATPVELSDDMGGDNEFNTKDVNFGTFGYYNAGYGDWRYSARHEFT